MEARRTAASGSGSPLTSPRTPHASRWAAVCVPQRGKVRSGAAETPPSADGERALGSHQLGTPAAADARVSTIESRQPARLVLSAEKPESPRAEAEQVRVWVGALSPGGCGRCDGCQGPWERRPFDIHGHPSCAADRTHAPCERLPPPTTCGTALGWRPYRHACVVADCDVSASSVSAQASVLIDRPHCTVCDVVVHAVSFGDLLLCVGALPDTIRLPSTAHHHSPPPSSPHSLAARGCRPTALPSTAAGFWLAPLQRLTGPHVVGVLGRKWKKKRMRRLKRKRRKVRPRPRRVAAKNPGETLFDPLAALARFTSPLRQVEACRRVRRVGTVGSGSLVARERQGGARVDPDQLNPSSSRTETPARAQP